MVGMFESCSTLFFPLNNEKQFERGESTTRITGLRTLATFTNTPPMFKISHLGVSKFGFLSLYLFRTENPNKMPILLLTQKLKLESFWERCSFEVKGKIGIAKDFLYGRGKVRDNQSLIHLSESF
jgi:hypothetical protein